MSDAGHNDNDPKNFIKNLKSKHTEKSEKSYKTNLENLKSMDERAEHINAVSPSFCTAKWVQSTVLLHNGHTHSCHHPPTHKIPLEEIADNPSALHNTNFKKEQRRKMLAGVRPAECQYCWNIEDLPDAHYSDRIYKSTNEVWSFPHLGKVLEAGATENINPTYFEVAFDNTCNFKCMYCTPDISTTWMDEVKKFGPYPTRYNLGNLDWIKQVGKMPYHHSEDNPYVTAFWKWWPDLYQDLDTFRITGGEPLLNQNTWKVLEWVSEKPRAEFNLAINTNMGVQRRWIEKLLTFTRKISPNIKTLEIYTSCEAHGEQADYIRYGLKYNELVDNVRFYLKESDPKDRVNFMITFNALSVTTFTKFLDQIGEFRKEFNPHKGFDRIPLMVSYLRWPSFQSVRVLPREIREKYAAIYREYAVSHSIESGPDGFIYLEEVDQINRLADFMLTDLDEAERKLEMKDFGAFYKEYDFRRNVDFEALFPELAEFYRQCLSLT